MNIKRIIREELEGVHEPNPEDWNVFVDDDSAELKIMLDLIFEDSSQYEVTIGNPARDNESNRIHVWDKDDYGSGAYVIVDKKITLEEFMIELRDESLDTTPGTHLNLQYHNLLSYVKGKSNELFNL